MSKEKDLRITIIGIGNLMEAIFPNIIDTIGEKNIPKQVNATTADAEDGKARKDRLGIEFEIILNDNLKALKDMEPHIIFFAPPPEVAPDIINGELKDYFEYLREKSVPLPDIYAFPPKPSGSLYKEVLGDDILVVNILPNSIRTIAGKPLKGEGVSSCTFPSPWPRERVDRLREFLSNMGEVAELKPEEMMPLLCGMVNVYTMMELVLMISDELETKGEKYDNRHLGEYMRARHQEETGFRPEESDPCSTASVEEGPIASLLNDIYSCWYGGLREYFSEVGISDYLSREGLNRLMDMILHVIQGESPETLKLYLQIGATKGGLLEKSLQLFHQNIEPLIKEAILGLPVEPDKRWKSKLTKRLKENSHAVLAHGGTLSG